MSHETHDDGLVHDHSWARTDRPPHERPPHERPPHERPPHERPPHERARSAAGSGMRSAPDAPRRHHAPAPDHDDGLVHDHAWARSERLSSYAAE